MPTGSRHRRGPRSQSSLPGCFRPFRSCCTLHRAKSQTAAAARVNRDKPDRSRSQKAFGAVNSPRKRPATCARDFPDSFHACAAAPGRAKPRHLNGQKWRSFRQMDRCSSLRPVLAGRRTVNAGASGSGSGSPRSARQGPCGAERLAETILKVPCPFR